MTGYTYIKPSENLKESHREVISLLEKIGAKPHPEPIPHWGEREDVYS